MIQSSSKWPQNGKTVQKNSGNNIRKRSTVKVVKTVRFEFKLLDEVHDAFLDNQGGLSLTILTKRSTEQLWKWEKSGNINGCKQINWKLDH